MLTEKTLNFFDLYSPSEVTIWQLGFTGGYFLHDTAVLLYSTEVSNLEIASFEKFKSDLSNCYSRPTIEWPLLVIIYSLYLAWL